MKNLILKLTAASFIIPVYTSANETAGMDMAVYTEYASYGFLLMLAAFFIYFLYGASHIKVYIPKPFTQKVYSFAGAGTFEKLIPALNGVYAVMIILMGLYAVSFAMQLLQ